MSTEVEPPTGDQDNASLDRLMNKLWWSLGIGLVALPIAYSTTSMSPYRISGVLAAVGIAVLIFLAAFACGSFLGFLFGVPRVLSRENGGVGTGIGKDGAGSQPGAAEGARPPEAVAMRGARLLESNTNLERISDWLTTMIVGATLVELHRLNDGLLMFRRFLEETAVVFVDGAGKPTAGALAAVGPIVLIFGLFCGFLYMYLSTRLVLVRLFNSVESWLSNGGKLPPQQQRAVRAFIAAESGVGTFVTRQVEAKRSLTIDDALSLMFDLLYKSSPEKVIELGGTLNNSEAAQRPDYWFYLAAAFGQKLRNAPADSDEWRSARDNALDSARRAVGLNSSYRDRLWRISNPDGSDDDLASLRRDPEFLRIVGRTVDQV